MSKKIIVSSIVVFSIIFTYSTITFQEIRAYKEAPVLAQKYDEDGAMKFPDTKEDIKKKEKALAELAEAIKRQEESSRNPKDENVEVKLVSKEKHAAVKLDRDKLDVLDNKMYAWWISLNNKHKPTTIPGYVQKIISKYDGIYIGNTSKKKIYLTFDEGYENGYTAQILDTLKKNKVKAVFFVTGPYIKGNPDLVKRMLTEGHFVGNHTIHHPSLPSLDAKSLENELFGLEKQFKEKFGTGFKYMRPPRGEYSEKVLAASKQLGYKTIFWSYAYMDFDVNNQKGADYAYSKVMGNLHNGAVILLHAVSRDNAEALDRIIKDARSQGYEISPFDL